MNPTFFRIPVDNVPQRFEINLSGNDLIIELVWNDIAQYWVISLYDSILAEPLLTRVPVLPFQNFLKSYTYIGLNGALFIQNTVDPYLAPGLDDFGTTTFLYWYPYP